MSHWSEGDFRHGGDLEQLKFVWLDFEEFFQVKRQQERLSSKDLT